MDSENTARQKPWPPAVLWAIRFAVIAVALYNLYNLLEYRGWLAEKLSEGLGLDTILWNNLFRFVIQPVVSVAAIVLAVLNKRVMLAALFAILPQLYLAGTLLLFAFAVFVYGI